MILPFMGLGLGVLLNGLWVGHTESRVGDLRKADGVRTLFRLEGAPNRYETL